MEKEKIEYLYKKKYLYSNMIAKKELGQIFLKNKKIIKNIIKTINPKKNQFFIEIGSGKGELTQEFIKYTNNITSIEIDLDLIKILKKKIKNNIKIFNINILNFNLFKYFNLKKKKFRIFGNIPYNISSKILIKLIKSYKIIKDIHIMVQTEFANNLILNKKKNSKNSIFTNIFFDVKKIFDVKNINFYPKPKVNSSFLVLKPNNNIKKIKKINNIKKIIYFSFIKKRKKIKNNLKNIINVYNLKKLNINPEIRAEKLSIKNFIKLINYIN